MSGRAYWEHMIRTEHRRRARRQDPDLPYRLLVGFGIATAAGGALVGYAAAVITFLTGGEYWALGFIGVVLGFGFTAATAGLILIWRQTEC